VARAAAAITSQGQLLPTRLVTAVHSPTQGWITLPVQSPTLLNLPGMNSVLNSLETRGQRYWKVLASARTWTGTLVWFISGTTNDWQGTPVSLALVLEEYNPNLADRIGQSILQSITAP